MAGMHHNDDDEIISGINVTPLVDIMLVLLIIFMMVSTFVNTPSIEVELPHAATGSEIKSETVSIVISKDGEYFIKGHKTEGFEDLASKVKEIREKNPDVQVVISADKKVYHENVVKVIDMIRRNEIYKFAINVEYAEE